jgi:hypothetical protein
MAAGFFGANNYFGNNAIGGGWNNPYGSPAIPAQTSNTIMCVIIQSESEVNTYLVAAGTTVMLICFNTGRFFLKGMDRNGIQMPIRAFNFSELQQVVKNDNNAQTIDVTAQPQQQTQASPQPVAATKDDIDRIEKQLAAITAAMGGANNATS